jgi:hypothetical protein
MDLNQLLNQYFRLIQEYPSLNLLDDELLQQFRVEEEPVDFNTDDDRDDEDDDNGNKKEKEYNRLFLSMGYVPFNPSSTTSVDYVEGLKSDFNINLLNNKDFSQINLFKNSKFYYQSNFN